MPDTKTIGLIGLDTSHVVAFTKLLNDPKNEHHVAGGKVICGFPGGSPDFEASISRVEGFTKQLSEEFGLEILDSPAAVAEKCDYVFIESVDGRVHLEQFRETLPFKKPTFIDKPLAVKSSDAREIYKLAADAGIPLISASGVRYDEGISAALASPPEGATEVRGADIFGPMQIQPTQPGLYWYGIHTVDALNRIMGGGCKKVQTDASEHAHIVTGEWADGRVATVRGNRGCHSGFGVTIHWDNGPQFIKLAPSKPWYASMLDAVMPSLATGKVDINPADTIEVIRLIEAANESADHGGKSVNL